MFEISKEETGAVSLEGRFDASQVEKARQVLGALEQRTTLDFAKLEYISSAGLGVLLATEKRLRAQGEGLRLVGVNAHIRDILRFSGFDQIFEVE